MNIRQSKSAPMGVNHQKKRKNELESAILSLQEKSDKPFVVISGLQNPGDAEKIGMRICYYRKKNNLPHIHYRTIKMKAGYKKIVIWNSKLTAHPYR
jgi:hypothetical protein